MNFQDAIVFDIETFPNCITIHAQGLYNNFESTWEISEFRDDRQALMQFLNWLAQTQTPMIGFNSVHFDYPVIHALFKNPQMTAAQLYTKAMQIIEGNDRFANTIWERDRFAPQIDLFKIHHFDNRAKSTSLKALQINMRLPSVVDMPVPVGTILTEDEINNFLIPYNKHDVTATKDFTFATMDAIKFRLGLVEQFGVDVLNWNDTKIGSKILEQRLGDELCFERVWNSTGFNGEGFYKRQVRQTPRYNIALKDIIFPYVQFNNPEFQRVLEYLKAQVLTADEIYALNADETARIKTKGVFTDLKAHVGGIDFYFGTGGIHGSVKMQRIISTDEWLLDDIDVTGLYPNLGIVNRLSPAHLGERFIEEYSKLPLERKRWQKEKGKKCVEANSLKLASNGTYGNTNNVYSPFYDPQYTMSITINGQLLLCMLAERLVEVPTLKIIQINTDGITYMIHRDHKPVAQEICKAWEAATLLTLEETNYNRMFIRDVNSYVAESKDGSLKSKGAYWTPDPLRYNESISESQPPAWHKDLGNTVSIRAAVAAMIYNVQPETFIRFCTNPYDFMLRVKVGRADSLMHGNQQVQKTSRYYVSTDGAALVKTSPPTGKPGAFKKANGVSDADYNRAMAASGGAWVGNICTKNKSQYENRETQFQAGYKTTVCNDISHFRFDNINYDWYVSEAKKLIV